LFSPEPIINSEAAMFNDVVGALVGAILVIAIAFLCWRLPKLRAQTAELTKALEAERERSERQRRQLAETEQALKADIVRSRTALFDALGLERPQPQTIHKISDLLKALEAELERHTSLLKECIVANSAGLAHIRAEAEDAKTVDRRRRYAGYVDALSKVNVNLDAAVGVCTSDLALLRQVRSRLERGGFDLAIGNMEFEAIERVLEDIRSHDAGQLMAELRRQAIRNEYQNFQEFRRKLEELAKRDPDLRNPREFRAANPLPDGGDV